MIFIFSIKQLVINNLMNFVPDVHNIAIWFSKIFEMKKPC